MPTDTAGSAGQDRITNSAALIEPQRVNERLEALRHECIRQKDLIYRCVGVPATESLPFLNRIIDLSLTLQGIGSMDTVADVIEMLDEEKW